MDGRCCLIAQIGFVLLARDPRFWRARSGERLFGLLGHAGIVTSVYRIAPRTVRRRGDAETLRDLSNATSESVAQGPVLKSEWTKN
jgi:hypothetical protein